MTTGQTLEETETAVEPELLFKRRLCVARFGEMDLAGWWNTQGVLGSTGRSVYRRGFPKGHSFTQARVVCAVAADRCREVFSPPGCITLWNLPPDLEDRLESSWQDWCRDTQVREPFFSRLAGITTDDLLSTLLDFELIDVEIAEAARGLRPGAEGRGLPYRAPEALTEIHSCFSPPTSPAEREENSPSPT